jgi:hypothetical protein
MKPFGDRFWAKIDRPPIGCWEWTASRTSLGYGKIGTTRSVWEFAHRIMWMLVHGPIPDGHIICHRCDNPPCVNPDHLFLGSHLDNFRDSQSKKRHAHGERHGGAKLSEAEAQQILADPTAVGRHLAKAHNVSPATICLLRKRETWRHL